MYNYIYYRKDSGVHMKTFAILLCAMIICIPIVHAGECPIAKGCIYLNGGAVFEKNNFDYLSDYNILSGSMTFGYFAVDHFMFGVLGMLDYYNGEYSEHTLYSVGGVIGYYYGNPEKTGDSGGRIFPFIKGLFLYGKQPIHLNFIITGENGYGDLISSGEFGVEGISYGGEVGMAIILSRHVGFDTFCRYLRSKPELEYSNLEFSRDRFTLGVAVSGYIY